MDSSGKIDISTLIPSSYAPIFDDDLLKRIDDAVDNLLSIYTKKDSRRNIRHRNSINDKNRHVGQEFLFPPLNCLFTCLSCGPNNIDDIRSVIILDRPSNSFTDSKLAYHHINIRPLRDYYNHARNQYNLSPITGYLKYSDLAMNGILVLYNMWTTYHCTAYPHGRENVSDIIHKTTWVESNIYDTSITAAIVLNLIRKSTNNFGIISMSEGFDKAIEKLDYNISNELITRHIVLRDLPSLKEDKEILDELINEDMEMAVFPNLSC